MYLGWWGYWGFYSSRVWTSPSGIRSLFLLGISLRRTLWDSFLMGIPLDSTKTREQVISLYTWYVGGKQTSISTVSLWWPFDFYPVALMRASAQWGCQSHEGINLRVSYEVSRHLLSNEEYYGNWWTRKMSSACIIAVIPCCRCKTSAYSWLHYLPIFLPHQVRNKIEMAIQRTLKTL